jgi:hypothetical protein
MFIIIDANTAHEMASSPAHGDAVPVLKWLTTQKGSLALGGRLTVELYRTPLKSLLVELARSGTAKIYPNDAIRAEESRLLVTNQCSSNDLHVIASAVVSGTRLLYSRDQRLQADFRSPNIINNPRGHVYSSADHEHLLRDASACRPPARGST